MMEGRCYFNGQISPLQNATIPFIDLGFLRGYGLFAYMRTYAGKPFHLWDHLMRLKRSLNEIGLVLPEPLDAYVSIIKTLLDQTSYLETSIRVIVTGGDSDQDLFLPQDATPRVYVIVYPFTHSPIRKEGLHVITRFWPRVFSSCKNLFYLPAISYLQRENKEDIDDILFYDRDDYLLEGSRANFFAIQGDALITPKENIFPGMTRNIILKLAQDRLDIQERDIKKEEIKMFDAAFLCSTQKEIAPIQCIDSTSLKTSSHLDFLRKAFDSYKKYFTEEVDPFSKPKEKIPLSL